MTLGLKTQNQKIRNWFSRRLCHKQVETQNDY